MYEFNIMHYFLSYLDSMNNILYAFKASYIFFPLLSCLVCWSHE